MATKGLLVLPLQNFVPAVVRLSTVERNDVLLTAVDMKDAILACSVKNFAVCALLKVRHI